MLNSKSRFLIESIRSDKVHGASQLARQAADVIRQVADDSKATSTDALVQELLEVARELEVARPPMAPLFNVVTGITRTLKEQLPGKGIREARQLAADLANAAIAQSYLAVSKIADHAAGLLKDGDVVLTHSYSSTVSSTLCLSARVKSLNVLVTSSGPGNTGISLAMELREYGIPVAVIDDAAIGIYTLKTNMIFVGADRITRDAMLINGVGTYPLVMMAHRAGIPRYTLCEKMKFDYRIPSSQVDLEDRDPAEIDIGSAAGLIPCYNPHFDVTPLALLSGIITETGIMLPHQVESRINSRPRLVPKPRLALAPLDIPRWYSDQSNAFRSVPSR
jgi:eIF-2B alpha/beta/delta-like uncharacterized protein